jgi:hypothetical protein
MKKKLSCGAAAFGLLLLPLAGWAQPSLPQFDPTHVYKITGKDGSVLSLPSEGASFSNAAAVYGPIVYSNVARQQWYIQDAGGGLYKLVSRASGMSLYQNNDLGQSYWYTAPRQRPYAGQAGERWAIVPTVSYTRYAIADYLTRGAIGVSGDRDGTYKNEQGETINRIFRDLALSFDSRLEITDVSTNSGVYTITNLATKKLLEMSNATEVQGARVQEWSNANLASQQWVFNDLGTGYFTIVNRNSGQALEIGGSDDQVRTPGTYANQWPLWGGDKQQWRRDYDPATNSYTLTNKASGYVLEIGGGETGDGAPANQWYGWGGTHQKWIIEYVSPN